MYFARYLLHYKIGKTYFKINKTHFKISKMHGEIGILHQRLRGNKSKALEEAYARKKCKCKHVLGMNIGLKLKKRKL